MKKISSLAGAVDFYLKTRRALGFTLKSDQYALTSLVRYAQRRGQRGPLTSSLAMTWAKLPVELGPPQWAVRLKMVRRFARFWHAYDPRTEIPAADLFGPVVRRRRVHLYTAANLRELLAATAILGPPRELRAASMKTLLGLLACTGLRVSEALHLQRQDIDWHNHLLRIRPSKTGQARIIPVEPSTLAALRVYERVRAGTSSQADPSAVFFLSSTRRPLPYDTVRDAFLHLLRHLGWTQRPRPRLHDLRHTFAVRCLIGWYENHQPIGQHMLSLSTYLGHRDVQSTYWYLSAVPELMTLASGRFQAYACPTL